MIPIFPEFKKLEFSDKDQIKSYSKGIKPYSDFNFTNLWSWNTLETREVSLLNDNLVVFFSDYKTNEMFLSFLGEKNINETAYTLLTSEKACQKKLKLIPEEIALSLDPKTFFIEEDEPNHDYVYSVETIYNLSGHQFKSKRHSIQKFISLHPSAEFSFIDSFSNLDLNEFYELMETWSKNKQDAGKEHQIVLETLALNRLLRSIAEHNLIISVLRNNGKLIGFGIDEILEDNKAISHFIKADTKHPGIYEFLNSKIAELLLTQNVQYWNWEQNLGIEGLRQIKESYKPVQLFKKYKVSLK